MPAKPALCPVFMMIFTRDKLIVKTHMDSKENEKWYTKQTQIMKNGEAVLIIKLILDKERLPEVKQTFHTDKSSINHEGITIPKIRVYSFKYCQNMRTEVIKKQTEIIVGNVNIPPQSFME